MINDQNIDLEDFNALVDDKLTMVGLDRQLRDDGVTFVTTVILSTDFITDSPYNTCDTADSDIFDSSQAFMIHI